jgi:hypothetical protein
MKTKRSQKVSESKEDTVGRPITLKTTHVPWDDFFDEKLVDLVNS